MTTCADCKKTITLVHTTTKRWKWLTNPKRSSSWHCGNDPKFPVKAHRPTETPR